MPEAKDIDSAPSAAAASAAGFELRLERGGAYLRLSEQTVAPGIRVDVLTLQIPDVKFPLAVGQGAAQFRSRLADLVELSVAVDASCAEGALAGAGIAAFGVEEPRVAAREGFVEIAGRLSGGPAFTLEAGLLPEGDQGVTLVFHSPRVLGPAPLSAAALPHLARTVLDALGTEILPRQPLAPLLRRVLIPRGWKLPRTGDARLSRAAVSGGAVHLAWDRAAAGPLPTAADPALLAADEGARTFAEAEALVARGDYPAAREAYLAAFGAAAHPFAAERLLALFVHDDRFHEEALDLAAEWLARRPGFAPALMAEAIVRLTRGEEERAARAFAALAADAAESGRAFLAVAAAEAAFGIPGAAREDALRAAEIALSVRRDHLAALRALRMVARAAGDREALVRANRRLVAYDPDPASKARAHAELGELLLEADPAGARLHLDHALRLAPDDAEALSSFARACASAGEPLRAVRALDRLKELLLAKSERARAAAAALDAGELWEGPLAHVENALLRYREAAELAPSADAHARAARAAEKAGHWGEAADQHAAVLDAIDPSAPGAAPLVLRTRIALADLAERLGDPAAAAAHLEKAAALGEGDAALLRRLVALQRTLGKPSALVAALDLLAAVEDDPAARAALLVEAAEAALGEGRSGDARARFTAAAAADPACSAALFGLARLARHDSDPLAERAALERLLSLSSEGGESAGILDEIALACERTGDLAAARDAAAAARRAVPTPARLETSLRLARASGDLAALAPLLSERARAAAAAGDVALATDVWLERARLLAADQPTQGLAALAEARALSPGHPAVLLAQADLAERTADHRLALESLRALLSAAPADAAALELRAARAALSAHELHAAREHADRALARGAPGAADVLSEYCALAPDDDAALARLADVHRAAGAFQKLEAILERRLHRAGGADAARLRLELSDLIAPRDPARAARLALEALDLDGASAAALRALTTPPRAAHVPPPARAALLARLAEDASATPEEATAALAARARLLADGGDVAGALAALRGAARLGPEPDDLVELRARIAAAAGDRTDSARALLERARRARERGEPGAAERLAEAGLAALDAGVAGAEEALEAALSLGPERETARAVLEARVGIARRRGDAAAEREALASVVPLLPTGARPAALLRVSLLALEAGDAVSARASAEEARLLAPRDRAAMEACRAAAIAQGDLAAVAALLADIALLDPGSAGEHLLERARLLASLWRADEADDAYSAALAALPPDRPLAEEQVRLRRDALPERAASAPIEAFALRAEDPREAASALRGAAALALSAGDLEGALRNARRSYALTEGDLAYAGPLLARILYLQGGAVEALSLHRRLLEGGFPGVAPEDAMALCRQAADLAETAGDRELALRALDELLRLRPQDIDAALQRFHLDADRARASRDLAASAEACRSRRRRALALATAAEAAIEAGELGAGEELFRRVRRDADLDPTLALAVARRRAEAIRAREGSSSPSFLEALHDAAAAAQSAGDRAAARELLDQAIARERERGLFADAARDLLQLDALAVADGDFAGSAARLHAAGALQREAGDLAGAVETLRAAYAADPDSDETFRRLEELLHARGPHEAPLLVELLADRAGRISPGPERAAILVRLADAQRAAGARDRAEAALREALVDVPGFAEAEDRLLAHLAEERRTSDRARVLLERAERMSGEARDALRRDAAATLAASWDPGDRALAAEVWRALSFEDPSDVEAARAAAGVLVSLGRREEAIPHLAALVQADPDDEVAASELLAAYADRPLERAELLLARAARVSGQPRALHLRKAATAFFAAGEEARARAALREAFEASPADDEAFAQAIRDAADPDRIDEVLLARALAVPADAAACHRERADALLATGRADDAVAAYEAALAHAPHDAELLAAFAACVSEARGDEGAAEVDAQLIARADAEPWAIAGVAEAPSRYRVGLALFQAGQVDEAMVHLERAVSLAPFDPHAASAWGALAQGHAARGAAEALAAARAREERSTAPALDEDRPAAGGAEAESPTEPGLQTADAAASGPERRDLLEQLASEREGAGDRQGAIEALLAALEADPGSDGTFAWLAALSDGDPEILARAAALRDGAAGAGAPWDFAASSSENSAPAPPLAFVTEGDGDAIVSDAAASDATPPLEGEELPSEDAQELAHEGRARFAERDFQGAYERLSRALAADPTDLTIARDLSRVAEKLGLPDEYVRYGEACADAIAAHDPLAAAARYRHFAEVLLDKLRAPGRAAAMLEKALALVPDDADTRRALIAAWADDPDSAPRALDAWLDIARHDPSDVTALAAVESLAERLAAGDDELRLRERGRLAASLASFVSPTHPRPPAAALVARVPPDARARVAVPGATGPLARLLALLAPWLEMLFPADLRRRGISPGDRLDARRSPALAAAFDGAARALRVRPHVVFLSSRDGVDVALENTRPPAVILGSGAEALEEAALPFLAARTLDLLDRGWALVGKFAPKDVAILLELACRFAGGTPPSLGLPAERAAAFFAVLESQVPRPARDRARQLGGPASQELAETDPRALAAALRRTANRVALLHAGDPGASLGALALLDRRLDRGPLEAAPALTLPDLRDLALFALSDHFLDLRTSLGEAPAP